MSDEPISIIAKIDNSQEYGLESFIEYFIDRGFHIEASGFLRNTLPLPLQEKLNLGGNFNYSLYFPSLLTEWFYLEEKHFDFNIDTYDNLYLPNSTHAEIEIYPEDGNKKVYKGIKIINSDNKNLSYQFMIGLTESFLLGKVLIVTIMNEGSKDILELLDYETDQLLFPCLIYPLIFRSYNIIEMLYINIASHRDVLERFFIDCEKKLFKQKVIQELEKDDWFYINYYNKSWSYQDYKDVGLIRGDFNFSEYEILLYQKYADNFNCPEDKLEKAWAWYKEHGYAFMKD